jgi:2-octaprenyl-6-methoxyphenol hydroxylase
MPRAHLLAPMAVASLERGKPGSGKPAMLTLSDGRVLRADLVVAADGRQSEQRKLAGIRTQDWSYRQTGIVCTVAHELPHEGVAQERFLPAGPFAILPMTDDAEGRHRSSLVWTEPPERAAVLLKLGPAEFNAEIAQRFGDHFGRLEAIGPRWSYPLNFLLAERYIDHRLALVGDAAHGIHPIAGQGLNLGLRDIAALIEIVVEAKRLGLDPGAADRLEEYARWRRTDTMVLAAVTDGLTRLFSNDIPAVQLARDLGLGAVQKIPPLKKLFMQHAMGELGRLPKLLQGQSL